MLFKTSEENKHYHVVLTPDVTKTQQPPTDNDTTVGVVKEHSHPLVDFDPETLVVVLGEVDGHTHTFDLNTPMEDAPLPKVDEKDETVRNFKSKFDKAGKNDGKSIEDAGKAFKYYNQEDNQWERDVKEGLDSEGRAALMFDQIGPNTDKIIGHFIQNNPDAAFFPVETGDEVIADIITTVVKHIWRSSNKDPLTEYVFTDEFVAGRGIFEPVIDFSKDIGGDIKVGSVPYNHMLTGPHNRLDMEDCEDQFRVRFLSANQGEMEFGDDFSKATEKAGKYPSEEFLGNKNIYDYWYKKPGDQWNSPSSSPIPGPLTDSDLKNLIFPVIDWYRKVYFKEYLFRGVDGIQPPIRLKRSDARQLIKAEVPYADRTSFTVQKLTFVADQELERLDTGFDFFPFEVTYGKKTRNGWRGKVIGAIDMQDEVNKRSSQMTEVVNRMAGQNWFMDGETFDPDEEEKFKKNGAKSGGVFKCRDLNNMPQKDDGTKFPSEVLSLEQNALQRMDMYFGGVLNVEEAGKLGSRGLLLQERTALKINEVFFKHYENAFKNLNKKLVAYIQRFYPPVKILRIIRSAPMSEEEASYQQMEDAQIIRLLSDTDLTKYDMAIDVVKSSPTFREAQSEMLKEMMGQGADIPLTYWVEHSSLPNKRKLLAEMEQGQQAQAEAQEKMAGSEMAKTLAAKLPEGSPIVLGLLEQSGYDIGAIMQSTGGFKQQGGEPPQEVVPAL